MDFTENYWYIWSKGQTKLFLDRRSLDGIPLSETTIGVSQADDASSRLRNPLLNPDKNWSEDKFLQKISYGCWSIVTISLQLHMLCIYSSLIKDICTLIFS